MKKRGAGQSVEDGAPDKFGFDRLEERLNHGIVVAISLSGHENTVAVAVQFGLLIPRAVLAAAVRKMNEPFGRTSHDERLSQRSQRQIAVYRSPIGQLTTRRENRSMTTAK